MPAFYRTAYSTLGHAFQQNVLGSADGLTLGPDVWRPASRIHLSPHSYCSRYFFSRPVFSGQGTTQEEACPFALNEPNRHPNYGAADLAQVRPDEHEDDIFSRKRRRRETSWRTSGRRRIAQKFQFAAALPALCCYLRMYTAACQCTCHSNAFLRVRSQDMCLGMIHRMGHCRRRKGLSPMYVSMYGFMTIRRN